MIIFGAIYSSSHVATECALHSNEIFQYVEQAYRLTYGDRPVSFSPGNRDLGLARA